MHVSATANVYFGCSCGSHVSRPSNLLFGSKHVARETRRVKAAGWHQERRCDVRRCVTYCLPGCRPECIVTLFAALRPVLLGSSRVLVFLVQQILHVTSLLQALFYLYFMAMLGLNCGSNTACSKCSLVAYLFVSPSVVQVLWTTCSFSTLGFRRFFLLFSSSAVLRVLYNNSVRYCFAVVKPPFIDNARSCAPMNSIRGKPHGRSLAA